VVPTASFRHEALFYASADEYVDRLVPFVRDGIDADEPVFVLLPPDRMEQLQCALGRVTDGVSYADMTRVGENPARIIPAWQDFVSRHAPGRPVRGIGEPFYVGRTDAERAECHLHEALLNVAFARVPIWILCAYDSRAVDAADVRAAHHNHPPRPPDDTVAFDMARDGAVAEWFAAPLSPAPACDPLLFDITTLGQLRTVVEDDARAFGLDRGRRDECVLVVSEIATNSVMYGGRRGTFCSWIEGGRLVYEIRDSGRIAEPMVGRVRPAGGQRTGRGLWLANQLADLVQVRSNGTGTVVRVHIGKPA
jgi:anti-sigma regulatory factor (Ser/Thr protein kinase)